MSRELWFHVTPDGAPVPVANGSNYWETLRSTTLHIGTVDTKYHDYSWAYIGGDGDLKNDYYQHFKIDAVTFARPTDAFKLAVYDTGHGKVQYTTWTYVNVPDNYVIPADVGGKPGADPGTAPPILTTGTNTTTVSLSFEFFAYAWKAVAGGSLLPPHPEARPLVPNQPTVSPESPPGGHSGLDEPGYLARAQEVARDAHAELVREFGHPLLYGAAWTGGGEEVVVVRAAAGGPIEGIAIIDARGTTIRATPDRQTGGMIFDRSDYNPNGTASTPVSEERYDAAHRITGQRFETAAATVERIYSRDAENTPFIANQTAAQQDAFGPPPPSAQPLSMWGRATALDSEAVLTTALHAARGAADAGVDAAAKALHRYMDSPQAQAAATPPPAPNPAAGRDHSVEVDAAVYLVTVGLTTGMGRAGAVAVQAAAAMTDPALAGAFQAAHRPGADPTITNAVADYIRDLELLGRAKFAAEPSRDLHEATANFLAAPPSTGHAQAVAFGVPVDTADLWRVNAAVLGSDLFDVYRDMADRSVVSKATLASLVHDIALLDAVKISDIWQAAQANPGAINVINAADALARDLVPTLTYDLLDPTTLAYDLANAFAKADAWMG